MPDNLSVIVEEWLQWLQSQVSLATLKAYTSDIKEFLRFLAKHHGGQADLSLLAALLPSDFRAWLAQRRANHLQVRSSRRAIAALRKFYHFLGKNYGISNQALSHIRLPRLSQTLPRPLTIEQTLGLLMKIPLIASQRNQPTWVGARDQAFFMLLYGAGLRISEALSLKAQDLSNDILLITGKGQKQRIVPILPQVIKALQHYTDLCPHNLSNALFVGVLGQPLNAAVAQRQLRYYRKVLEFPDTATPHALRHSCATHLMNSSHDLRAIQELLGHAKLSTTQIYTKLEQQELLATFALAHPRMRN